MCKTIVIGNGPSASTQKLGAQIDRADNIIRINDFKVYGYEEYVGTRTTLLFTCRLNEYLKTIHQFPEVVLCLLMNPLDGVTIPDHVIWSQNIVHRIDWREVQALSPVLGLRQECYPTTGFLAILYALRRFGHVHIVGFDGLLAGNRHYYEDGQRAEPVRHDGTRERDWINTFKTLGLVTELSGPQYPEFYKFDGHAPLISQPI